MSLNHIYENQTEADTLSAVIHASIASALERIGRRSLVRLDGPALCPKTSVGNDQISAVADSTLNAIIQTAIDVSLAKINERGITPVPRRWLRTPAAARYISYDEATLIQMRKHGGGPRFRRCGSRVVYDVRDLDAFVERHPLVEPNQRPVKN